VQIGPGLTFGALPLEAISLEHCAKVMRNLSETAKRLGGMHENAVLGAAAGRALVSRRR
jgi:hypothetical protein